MIHYIIDSHNLLHSNPELAREFKNNYKKAFESLVAMVAKFALANQKQKITMVFDGVAPDIYPGVPNLYIEESGTHQIADIVIKDYIRSSINPKNLKIVSSDADLVSFAKMNYSQTYTSEDFLQELQFLSATPLEEEETKIYNKIKNEKREKTLLESFLNKELSADDFYMMGFDTKDIPRHSNIKKTKKSKFNSDSNEKLDLSPLEDRFKNNQKASKLSELEKSSEFDKINELNKRLSDKDFDDLESLFLNHNSSD